MWTPGKRMLFPKCLVKNGIWRQSWGRRVSCTKALKESMAHAANDWPNSCIHGSPPLVGSLVGNIIITLLCWTDCILPSLMSLLRKQLQTSQKPCAAPTWRYWCYCCWQGDFHLLGVPWHAARPECIVNIGRKREIKRWRVCPDVWLAHKGYQQFYWKWTEGAEKCLYWLLFFAGLQQQVGLIHWKAR